MRGADAKEMIHTGNFPSYKYTGPHYFLIGLVLQDFKDPGDDGPSPYPEFDPALGVVTNQEKMKRFLAAL